MTLLELRERKKKEWEEKLQKLQEVEAWYQTYPLIPAYRPRLTDPSPFWYTVYRQKHAFEVAATHPEVVHVFALEANNIAADANNKGQRKYVITTHLQLWHTIYHLAARGKHTTFYEVIPEGSVSKLYFDLEFSRTLNPECSGAEMVQTFIEFVCGQILEEYQIQCDVHQVINLDATTDTKFSRHLIFNLPQAVFKDNVQAGNFVRSVCGKISRICQATETQSIDGEPDAKRQKKQQEDHDRDRVLDAQRLQLQKLFVKNKDGCEVLFVDQGVYTRNRNFRLYKCIKKGKNNPLLMADDNKYKPHMPKKSATSHVAGQEAMERQFFLDSLITNISYSSGTRVLAMEHEEEWSDRGPSHLAKKDDIKQDSQGNLLEGFAHSPFPELDDFVCSVVTIGGIQGMIRRWLYFTQGQLLVYDIIKNRWCGNIQRQHKSNNIMILVDLRRGVYYQKCHDPDCRAAGYKSPDLPLPSHLLPSFGEDIDDEELLAAVTAVESGESAHDHGEDWETWPGTSAFGEVSDEELLAATLQIEGNVEFKNIVGNGAEQKCTMPPQDVPVATAGKDYSGDVTESDEELLAVMADIESHSAITDNVSPTASLGKTT